MHYNGHDVAALSILAAAIIAFVFIWMVNGIVRLFEKKREKALKLKGGLIASLRGLIR